MPNQSQRWKCVSCGKDFGVGDWTCTDGITNHVVPEKTYRSLDAPTDPSTKDAALKDGRTVVCNVPPATKVMHGDEVVWVGEGSVEFVRGRFATTDPVQQHWLDAKPAYNASEEAWEVAWLSQSQKLEIREMRLKAGQERLENERNELLAQTQAKVRKPETAAVR